MNLKIISAGAGSGKTHRLTSEMVALLNPNNENAVRASGIIATTFTKKAAAELQERVRVRLLEEGLTTQADDLTNALIGTVHGLGVKLLRRFSFEAGVSPQVDIIADEDQQVMFNQALSMVLSPKIIAKMGLLSDKLGLTKREQNDWRGEVKRLTDIARSNDFGIDILEKSKKLSVESFKAYLPSTSTKTGADFNQGLYNLLDQTIVVLSNKEKITKGTQTALNTFKAFKNELNIRGGLKWHQWMKISKIKVGKSSKDDVFDLVEYALTHDRHPDFHADIKSFIEQIFDIAVQALQEYENYKKSRGLIDYVDMEIHVKRLLSHPNVQAVLTDELDLLMVDEFQDTSPLQLEIFLKLSQFAQHSIWVGDPKQSIYGFRGADPKLMKAIIDQTGGVKEEDIQEYSWRSREDVVLATNAIFKKAFPELPTEQIALKPKRTKLDNLEDKNFKAEPLGLDNAIIQWHIEQENAKSKRLPGKPWMENCIASQIQKLLQSGKEILPKGERVSRKAKAGDIAVLCRSNKSCQDMANALYNTGIKAAISRSGLLQTAEAKVILACLKYILNHQDALSIAEVLFLAAEQNLGEIIDDRLRYLEAIEKEGQRAYNWAVQNDYIKHLDQLRGQIGELSSTEILNLVIEELDLRRIIAKWGNVEQRFDNIDALRQFAINYENACNRLHSAASLGGFLLWLNDLARRDSDSQGSGESPDAVNVLTYHKSKGLEWPIVICHDLEGNLRDSVWGMDIVAEKEEVDLNNILGHRWLRYWVNPYADQIKNTKLEEKINETEIKKQATKNALEEEARLLYVGITRARDYLIFPTRAYMTKWLNRIWHGNENTPTLDPHIIANLSTGTYESPWEWNGQTIPIDVEIAYYEKIFTRTPIESNSFLYFADKQGWKAHDTYKIDVEKELWSDIQIRSNKPDIYANPLNIETEAKAIAKMLKAFLIADRSTALAQTRERMAEGFLSRYDLEEHFKTGQMILVANRFFNHLNQLYNINKVHRKYPVRLHQNGRLFERIIDYVIETNDNKLIIIQNSSFTGGSKNWRKKAQDLGLWMHLARTALVKSWHQPMKETDCQSFVHYVLGGALVEVYNP